jgi:multisubunit Na+/H+ antiporter MnhE subunit
MLESRISRGLMLLGAGIGLMSIGVWALEVQVNVPDWMIRVAMIKLAFIASAGLLAAGAVVGRHARTRKIPGEPGVPKLAEGDARPPGDFVRKTPQGVKRGSDTPL